jgi:hypothetical protein
MEENKQYGCNDRKRHGGKKKGVARESKHVGKHNRLSDQYYEFFEVLLVQIGNGHCFSGSVKKS